MKRKISILVITFMLLFSLTSCDKVGRWVVDEIAGAHKTYVVHFDPNGGEGKMEDFVVKEGDQRLFPNCTFTKEGYECLGWSMKPNAKKIYGDTSSLSMDLPWLFRDGDTVTLYAVWTTPGFTFEVEGIAWFYSATIVEYDGDAKDVVVPVFTNGHYNWEGDFGCYNVDRVESGVFKGHAEIENVTNFPGNHISSRVFYDCTSLRRLQCCEEITYISEQAFYNCHSLQSLEIGTSNQLSIESEAFYGCTSIKKLVIPCNVKEIGTDAFYGWTEDQIICFEKYTENTFGDAWLNGCNATIIWGEKDVQ